MVTTEANELAMKSKKRSITPEDVVAALKVCSSHQKAQKKSPIKTYLYHSLSILTHTLALSGMPVRRPRTSRRRAR